MIAREARQREALASARAANANLSATDARCLSSARGNAAGRSAARALTTSAFAGMSRSKDCPIAWGTRASRIGRAVGRAPARVPEHRYRNCAAERRDAVASLCNLLPLQLC
jgi:hypothetical protein